MAKRNYLAEGLSRTGKSSVYEELIRGGQKAISNDRGWAYHTNPDTGLPGGPVGHDTCQVAVSELESQAAKVLFVCGGSRNSDRFLHYLSKVFNLRIDDDTMRRPPRSADRWGLAAWPRRNRGHAEDHSERP
jgi:hypothetical protein